MNSDLSEHAICAICSRPLGRKETSSKHHLIPKSKGGKHTETITIHNICHQKIHKTITEKELKNEFYSVEKLLMHPEIQKFIKWVAKKDPDFFQSNKRMKR